LIEPAADHRAVEHDDRADGHFPAPPRFTGQLERSAHELLIHTAASYVRWPPAGHHHGRCSNSLFYHAAVRERLGLAAQRYVLLEDHQHKHDVEDGDILRKNRVGLGNVGKAEEPNQPQTEDDDGRSGASSREATPSSIRPQKTECAISAAIAADMSVRRPRGRPSLPIMRVLDEVLKCYSSAAAGRI
jgi:hypothetical protein